MNCSHCQTRNPIGSRYCRQCGTEMAPPAGTLAEEEARQVEAERTREQAAELLARAHRHFERGETESAIPLAEEASRLLPESTAAHSLRATLYEAARRTEEALAAQERVVALNPDSAVDRDKLDRMRRGVHFAPRIETVDAEEPRRRWIPWLAAGAAGIAALWIGFAISNPREKRTDSTAPTPSQVQAPTPTPANPTWSPVSPTGTPPRMAMTTSPPAGPVNDPFERRVSPPTPAPPTPDPAANPASGAVPPTLPGIGQAPPTFTPVPPVVVSPVPPAQRPNSISAFPPAQGPRETVPAAPPAGTGATGTGGTTPAAPPTNNSYIRIQINPPKQSPPEPAPDRGGPREDAGDPLLKAQTLQAAGKWREAIAWFRNAEFAGAEPGDCHQGVALCHQRLAEWDNARASYRKAIAAFEKHRGTPRWRIAERSWSACKAALEVLGG